MSRPLQLPVLLNNNTVVWMMMILQLVVIMMIAQQQQQPTTTSAFTVTTTTTTTTTNQYWSYFRRCCQHSVRTSSASLLKMVNHEVPTTTTNITTTTPTTTSTTNGHYDTTATTTYTNMDEKYLQLAVQYAQMGYGYTYPNPAVGCVIVLSSTSTSTSTSQSQQQQQQDDDDNDEEIVYQQQHQEQHHVIIGQGYHPYSGYPHAEIFALLQAAGHVPCGILAANAVIQHYNKNQNQNQNSNSNKNNNNTLYEQVLQLTQIYQGINGTQELFENCLQRYYYYYNQSNSTTTNKYITMYVTLEPCCHIGKRTPPCTGSIIMSYNNNNINNENADTNSNGRTTATSLSSSSSSSLLRIVVGARDPNPKVDGGGIRILQQHQVENEDHHHHDHSITNNNNNNNITIVTIPSILYNQIGTGPYNSNKIISNFAKRITFLPTIQYTNEINQTKTTTTSTSTNNIFINGRIRRGLRTLAGQMIQNNTLQTVSWGCYSNITTKEVISYKYSTINLDTLITKQDSSTNNAISVDKNQLLLDAVNAIEIYPPWMEYIDGLLWDNELVLLRLNNVHIKKRKGVLLLGQRIASSQNLNAHIVQSLGHTILLYRPSSSTTPIIDLNQFDISNNMNDDDQDDDNDEDN